jgi:hypothetical protein
MSILLDILAAIFRSRNGGESFFGDAFGRKYLLIFFVIAGFISGISFASSGSSLGLLMGIGCIVGIAIVIYSLIQSPPNASEEETPWEKYNRL